MYTRCPKCSTCFRVTERHLAIAKGKVRCGQCQFVFNAPENAIDDLPAKSNAAEIGTKSTPPVTPTRKTETKAPLASAQEAKAVTTKTSITEEKNIESAEVIEPRKADVKAPVFEANTTMIADTESIIAKNEEVKPQKPVIKKTVTETPEIEKPVVETSETETPESETPIIEKPRFDADKTLIAETGILNKHNLDSIDLDTPSEHQHSFGDNGDDSFDDSFDLNAAIDELDQAAEDEGHIFIIEDEPVPTESKKDIAKNNSGDIFTTDAYDATSADSVADILNEMEGQLSLDIEVPGNDSPYDANNEFEFIQLDDEREALTTESHTENKEETNDKTLRKHFDFDDALEEQDEPGDNYSEEESIIENLSDEDKLFDQIDISDFQDNDVAEDITLDESHSQFIGQHNADDENDIPFQLRNNLEHPQTTSTRRIHPVFKLIFIVILFSLSFSQLAYFRAHEFVRLIPSSQPILEQFCEKMGCHYSGPRDTKQIQLISRDVRLHPKAKNALLISAAMVNNAPFAQPYPDIHIRLSDISGNVIAERIFNAKTYMGKLSNPFLLMKPKTPVHINFEVVDPGKDAVNFEFTFL